MKKYILLSLVLVAVSSSSLMQACPSGQHGCGPISEAGESTSCCSDHGPDAFIIIP